MNISVKLQDVRDNPYRDLEHCPLVEETIVKLMQIFERDGFTGALPARKRSDTDLYEIAWGHHRIEALRRLHKEEVNLDVQNYSDAQMLRRLHEDNAEELRALCRLAC
jgi:ParB-like chromosome segregation protein Spo0J